MDVHMRRNFYFFNDVCEMHI